MPTTTRTDYLFKVAEYADGRPWITTVSRHEPLPVLDKGSLGFNLPEDTSFERAKEIAAWLNDNILDITFTDFSDM